MAALTQKQVLSVTAEFFCVRTRPAEMPMSPIACARPTTSMTSENTPMSAGSNRPAT